HGPQLDSTANEVLKGNVPVVVAIPQHQRLEDVLVHEISCKTSTPRLRNKPLSYQQGAETLAFQVLMSIQSALNSSSPSLPEWSSFATMLRQTSRANCSDRIS
ncbi:unnamed protein product, partial [Ixodes persulcatus]